MMDAEVKDQSSLMTERKSCLVSHEQRQTRTLAGDGGGGGGYLATLTDYSANAKEVKGERNKLYAIKLATIH